VNSLQRPFHRVAVATLLFLTMLAWHAETLAAELTTSWVNNTADAIGISVERSTGSTGAFTEIATTGPANSTFTDRTVTAGSTYCYRVRAYNATAYSDYSNTSCAATAAAFGLSVVMAGTGTGVVISTPSGILCGTTCSGTFASGTAVPLTATPETGSTFAGWSGGGCTGSGTCTVTVTSTTAVTATFNVASVARTEPLTLTVGVSGKGTVTSTPAGINCGKTCSANYPSGTAMTLTATPGAGFSFRGWGGACTGTGSCAVSMSTAQNVTATFTRKR
jgi:hypothetical protein